MSIKIIKNKIASTFLCTAVLCSSGSFSMTHDYSKWKSRFTACIVVSGVAVVAGISGLAWVFSKDHAKEHSCFDDSRFKCCPTPLAKENFSNCTFPIDNYCPPNTAFSCKSICHSPLEGICVINANEDEQWSSSEKAIRAFSIVSLVLGGIGVGEGIQGFTCGACQFQNNPSNSQEMANLKIDTI